MARSAFVVCLLLVVAALCAVGVTADAVGVDASGEDRWGKDDSVGAPLETNSCSDCVANDACCNLLRDTYGNGHCSAVTRALRMSRCHDPNQVVCACRNNGGWRNTCCQALASPLDQKPSTGKSSPECHGRCESLPREPPAWVA